nr:ribosomal protein S3 [Chloromonas rosae]
MGQKVHPIGFRVGITKRHQSQWFARFTKYAYAQSLLEDRMLRNTLISVANEALNSNLIKKRDSAFQQNVITPKVTHIKIERGLIPYEIGIQIHAQAPLKKLKSSLNNLKINRELLCKLQKTRRYLMSLGKQQSSKLKSEVPLNQDNLINSSPKEGAVNKDETVLVGKKNNFKKVNPLKKKLFCFSSANTTGKQNLTGNTPFFSPLPTGKERGKAGTQGIILQKGKLPTKQSLEVKGKFSFNPKFKKRRRPNFLSLVYKKKKMIIKRLQKRQKIRQRYRRLMLKGLFVKKKGKRISCVASLFFSKKQIKKASAVKKKKSNKGAKKMNIKSVKSPLTKNTSFLKKGSLPVKQNTNRLVASSFEGSGIEQQKDGLKQSKTANFLAAPKKLNKQQTSLGTSGTTWPSLLTNSKSNKNIKEKLLLLAKLRSRQSSPQTTTSSASKAWLLASPKKLGYSALGSLNKINASSLTKLNSSPYAPSWNVGYRIKKKFVSLFLNKINKRFLKQLKEQMTQWNKSLKQHRQDQIKLYGALRFAPLGYNQKWSLKRLNFLKKKPLFKLLKLIKIIEKKSLIKLETLRKDFIAFGTISKSEALSYYQIINFLKNLKIASLKLKKDQKRLLVKTLTKDYSKISVVTSSNQEIRSPGENKDVDTLKRGNKQSIMKTLPRLGWVPNQARAMNPEIRVSGKSNFATFLTSSVDVDKSQGKPFLEAINNECRKINFIEYLKEMVKKHRTNNLFYYLSTISDARKNLKKIKQFTKVHSKFLFGFEFNQPTAILETSTLSKNTDSKDLLVFNKIKTVIDLASKKSDFEKGLPEIFLEQLEKQRNMYKQLAKLRAKISIKFYSVKSENVKIKAAIISDSVIDALEKRKAFRKVIKDAKENLMRNSKVKGVKIQVSGRLNGAEIARTEWVRSGRVPLQTLRANLDYSYKTAKTIYGIIGVKVWIFKGYTKLV